MQALEGVRVLELAAYISGPLAGKLLADLGASVIKLEPPDGDPARRWGKSGASSPWFRAFNLSKQSVVLPQQAADGKRALSALIDSADVVLTNLPEPRQSALGVSAPQIHALNDRAVHLEIRGDTTDGRNDRAFDSVAQAAAGLIRSDGATPEVIPFPICDTSAALVAVSQILAGYLLRQRGERSIALSVSLTEAACLHRVEAFTLFRSLDLRPTPESRRALAQIYLLPTSDARWVVVHLSSSERAWRDFCRSLGLPEDLSSLDRGRRISRYSLVCEVASSRSAELTAAGLCARLAAARVPHSLVRTESELSALAKSGQLHGIQNMADVVSVTLPMARKPPAAAPRLGEHTDQVLAEVLGTAGYNPG